jgi:hypothetical protein
MEFKPKSEAELLSIIADRSARRLPFFTSGHQFFGTLPAAAGITAIIDTSEMRSAADIDALSLTAAVYAGTTFHGLAADLKHFQLETALKPGCPAWHDRPIVEWLAHCGAQGASTVPEGFSEAALAVSALWPDGGKISSLAVPRAAAGPDLDHLFFGTGNILGILTGAVLRLIKTPPQKRDRLVAVDEFLHLCRALSNLGKRQIPAHELSACKRAGANEPFLVSYGVRGDAERADVLDHHALSCFLLEGARGGEGKVSEPPFKPLLAVSGPWNFLLFFIGELKEIALYQPAEIRISQAIMEGASLSVEIADASLVMRQKLMQAAVKSGVSLEPCALAIEEEELSRLYYGPAGKIIRALKRDLDADFLLNPGVKLYDPVRP